MIKLPITPAHAWFLGLATLASLALAPASLPAQAASAQTSKPAGETSSAPGFSIETEMLTYRALESNSEAIACEVAAYLHGTSVNFKNPPPGTICNVSGNGATGGVVILPFDRSVYSDFQVWRSDMQTMAEFEQRGASACAAAAAAPTPPRAPAGIGTRGLTGAATTAATAATGAMGVLSPAGAALSTASGVLGLFASNHDASPVGGTIQDQAFMDNVGRELRAVNVSVLMPSAYTSFALSSIDAERSPFLIALDKLLHTRDCIVASRGPADPDVKNIDDFLGTLSSSNGPAKSSSANPPSGSTTAAAAAPAATSSHLESVLSADGLAQRLGADPQTGKIPDTAPQHILLLKALESGGSVSKSSNIFGTKMSYSGGSVGTYALFNLNGQVECSGNVYNYAGSVSSKDFQKQLLGYVPDPSTQVIFQRGSCRAPQ
jgi:hypothetical protein